MSGGAARGRVSRLTALAGLSASLALAACVSTVPADYYRDAGSKDSGGYGYTQSQGADGAWSLKFVLPSITATTPEVASGLWDRRAAEICGHSNFKKTIHTAQRGLEYDSYNRVMVAGRFRYEGFLDCGTPPAP